MAAGDVRISAAFFLSAVWYSFFMVFHDHRIHADARRTGHYDIIPGLAGEINFTVHAVPSIPTEWHQHRVHTDYFAVAQGRVLFRLVREDGTPEEKIILSSNDSKTLIVPPGVWHNYLILEPDTILVFYISHPFDIADEFRRPCDPSGWHV